MGHADIFVANNILGHTFHDLNCYGIDFFLNIFVLLRTSQAQTNDIKIRQVSQFNMCRNSIFDIFNFLSQQRFRDIDGDDGFMVEFGLFELFNDERHRLMFDDIFHLIGHTWHTDNHFTIDIKPHTRSGSPFIKKRCAAIRKIGLKFIDFEHGTTATGEEGFELLHHFFVGAPTHTKIVG